MESSAQIRGELLGQAQQLQPLGTFASVMDADCQFRGRENTSRAVQWRVTPPGATAFTQCIRFGGYSQLLYMETPIMGTWARRQYQESKRHSRMLRLLRITRSKTLRSSLSQGGVSRLYARLPLLILISTRNRRCGRQIGHTLTWTGGGLRSPLQA